MSMVKSQYQLTAEGFNCKPLHLEVLHMLYALSMSQDDAVSSRDSGASSWYQTRVKAVVVLGTPRKHSLLRLKWLHEVCSCGVFSWSICYGWKSRRGGELLMALWWHFSVTKDRTTQSRNKDKQKGLTPFIRLIKEMNVIAFATRCYHVWRTKGWWSASPDISAQIPKIGGIAIFGIAGVKTLIWDSDLN